MPKVQCRVCSKKQDPSDVCRRCGSSLPVSVIYVEKIVERVCPQCNGREIFLGTYDEFERVLIMDRIRHFGGDNLKAASSLGIGKTTLYRKLKQYQVGG